MKDPFATKLMTVSEASKALRLHEMTVYRMLKRRELPSIRVGGRWRIPTDIIDRLLKGERP